MSTWLRPRGKKRSKQQAHGTQRRGVRVGGEGGWAGVFHYDVISKRQKSQAASVSVHSRQPSVTLAAGVLATSHLQGTLTAPVRRSSIQIKLLFFFFPISHIVIPCSPSIPPPRTLKCYQLVTKMRTTSGSSFFFFFGAPSPWKPLKQIIKLAWFIPTSDHIKW